jgi:hypothetical protein
VKQSSLVNASDNSPENDSIQNMIDRSAIFFFSTLVAQQCIPLRNEELISKGKIFSTSVADWCPVQKFFNNLRWLETEYE